VTSIFFFEFAYIKRLCWLLTSNLPDLYQQISLLGISSIIDLDSDALLIYDSENVHKGSNKTMIRNLLEKLNISSIIISGKMTSYLQHLDNGPNLPFKNQLIKKFEQHLQKAKIAQKMDTYHPTKYANEFLKYGLILMK